MKGQIKTCVATILIAVLAISLVAFSEVLESRRGIVQAYEEGNFSEIIEKIRNFPELRIAEKRVCKVDEDCLNIICPQAIGIDTPRCIRNKCVCGPNPKINISEINETLILKCLRIRNEIREKIKASNISEQEMIQIRERYRECLPQPTPIKEEVIGLKVREIVKRYAEEKRNLTESFVESIKELNELKIDLILSGNLTGKELAEKIKEINEKIKEIVKEYVEKLHELNLARREELKEVIEEIKVGRKVEIDRAFVNVSRIVIKVNDKEIEIKPGDNVTIIVEGVVAKSVIPLRIRNNTIIDEETNKTINITPERIRERVRERIREMTLERKGSLIVYNVKAEKTGRILGLIPVNIQVNYEISAEDGKEISVRRPWWNFLVFG